MKPVSLDMRRSAGAWIVVEIVATLPLRGTTGALRASILLARRWIKRYTRNVKH